MKKIFTIIVLVTCICTMMQAQSESEARSSANYYGEASSSSQDAAIGQAKISFIAKIKPDMMKDAQFRKVDDVTCRKIADQAKALVVKKGSKLTAIVYIAKNELKRVYAEAVMFDELPDDGLDENGNPRDPSVPAPSAKANPVPASKVSEGQQVVVVSDGYTTSQPVVSQPATSQPAPQTNQQSAQVTQPAPVSQPVHVVAPPVPSAPAKTGNKLLDEILDAHNLFELNDFFTKGKNTGALAYGRLSTMTAPENSYLLLYQPDGTIVAVYDRGSTTRRNLRTGNTENYANAFNNVKIIWFQLYQ